MRGHASCGRRRGAPLPPSPWPHALPIIPCTGEGAAVAHSAHAAQSGPGRRGDAAEIPPRCRRDSVGIRSRREGSGRDDGSGGGERAAAPQHEIQPRYRRDAAAPQHALRAGVEVAAAQVSDPPARRSGEARHPSPWVSWTAVLLSGLMNPCTTVVERDAGCAELALWGAASDNTRWRSPRRAPSAALSARQPERPTRRWEASRADGGQPARRPQHQRARRRRERPFPTGL